MTLRVIGAGLGRTGTLSLKGALERLDFGPCYHMVEVFKNPEAPARWVRAARGADEWDAIFAGYRSAVDWPACAYYETLARRYPDAKVILTRRDPDAWFTSTQATIFEGLEERVKAGGPWAEMVQAIIIDAFGGRLHERDHVIAAYEAHNARVRRVIAPERLLDFEVAQGWAPLCSFLGRPVPDEPFPRVNSTEDFKLMREQLAKQTGGPPA